MKEIREIINQYDRLKKTGQSMALATVFDVKGSSYRRTGARMLITDNGTWFGGISGGCIEGNALKKAQMVMSDGKTRIVTYDTENNDESSIGVSLGCNGVISVIITPLNHSMKFDPISKLRKVLATRETEVLLTILKSNSDQLVEGSILDSTDLHNFPVLVNDLQTLSDEMEAVRLKGKSKTLELKSGRILIEAVVPDIHLIIMGGNYDIFPLLEIANKLDWKTTVVSNPRRIFTPATELADNIISNLNETTIDGQTVGVVMSHDYQLDLINLKASLSTALNYIGVLGPAVRRQDMLNEIRESGFVVDESKIFGPAGLDIGAQQPEEIAVAIIAEIISVLRNRDARSLREREGAIHDR